MSKSRIQARRDLAFLILAGLFLGTLSILNILGLTRFLLLGNIGTFPIIVAVGALPYPITFLCTDLISELWGERKANQVVLVGLVLNIWVIIVLWIGGLVPALPGSDDSLFFIIQKLTFSSVGASMIAYLAAQFVDVKIFHYLKDLTNGKALWLRNNVSTVISQLIDTSIVVLISRYVANILPITPDKSVFVQLINYIFSGYLFKLLVALADTFPFIWLTGWLRILLDMPRNDMNLP